LADKFVGQAVARVRPVIAAVDRLVDAAFARRTAAYDRPRLALRAPGAGIHLVGIRPVDRDRRDAGLFVDEQHFLPRLAAVPRPEDAAFGSPTERIALSGHIDDVGILWMDFDL